MAYQTPKTDWTEVDAVTETDLNRIEGNTAQNHSDIDTLDGTVTTHTEDTTIHKTSATIRGEGTTALVIECRTADPESPTTGMIWLRTDL